jgi:signal transduction histidine kinase
MLAFARREELAPKVVEHRGLVGRLEGRIRGAVGAQIASRFDMADGTWLILVDPHQLEVVLLNLGINAHDPIAGKGRLRVGLRNRGAKEPRPPTLGTGDYVVLSAEDSGCDMDEGTTARVFELFFTTKPMGQGLGLV